MILTVTVPTELSTLAVSRTLNTTVAVANCGEWSLASVIVILTFAVEVKVGWFMSTALSCKKKTYNKDLQMILCCVVNVGK